MDTDPPHQGVKIARRTTDKQKHEKDKRDATLAEKAQAEKTGISPEQRRAEITEAYERSDTAGAFRAALEQHGYVLAKGDRRDQEEALRPRKRAIAGRR